MRRRECELKGDLLDTATADALPADVQRIDAAHELAMGSGFSTGNPPEVEGRPPRQTAHETGYECARRLRQHLFGANGGPVADMLAAAPARRLVTPANTWDQQASRAFAAEFLAPASALAKHVAGPVSFSDVDELGDEYRVSSLVIEHQIDNHQLGYVTDA